MNLYCRLKLYMSTVPDLQLLVPELLTYEDTDWRSIRLGRGAVMVFPEAEVGNR